MRKDHIPLQLSRTVQAEMFLMEMTSMPAWESDPSMAPSKLSELRQTICFSDDVMRN